MTFFDLILLLILFGFIWFGFWNGLVRTVGGIIGVIISVFVASRWYEDLAVRLLPILGDNFNLSRILSFIAVMVIAHFILSVIIRIIDKFFKLPFLNIINRLAGGFFGLIEGALVIGLVLYFSTKFPLGTGWLQALDSSRIAPTLIGFGKVLLPLLPEALKQIKSLL